MQQKAQAEIEPLAPAIRAELQISHFSSLFAHPVVGTRCTWHAGPSYVSPLSIVPHHTACKNHF